MSDKVKTEHPLYRELQTQRDIIQDVRGGTKVLRAKKATYLKKFEAESDESYKHRTERAVFLNLYSKTEQTLTGLMFHDPIELGADVPPSIAALMESVDSEGSHLDVFAKNRALKSFDGASCILVDYPPSSENATAEDDKNRKVYWVGYDQSQVINWKYRNHPITKKKELSLIVLKETIDGEVNNLFEHESITQYRVFFFDELNQVNAQIFREKQKDGKGFIEVFPAQVVKHAKDAFTEIPLAIIGRLENAPPLMDVAEKNLEHYRIDSDRKYLIHKTCVPIPVGTEGVKNIEIVSGDNMIEIPEGGSFQFVEVSGSSLDVTRQALEDIKSEIGMLGISTVLDDKTQPGQMTATEVLLDSVDDKSFLATRAREIQDALEKCLIWTALYMGEDQGGSLELGTAWRKVKEEAENKMLLDSTDKQGDALVN